MTTENTMKDSEVLIEARALIDTPQKWVQDRFCGAKGDSFCIEGAVCHVLRLPLSDRYVPETPVDVLSDLVRERVFRSLVKQAEELRPDLMPSYHRPRWYNDFVTHQEVMDLMDKTIAGLQEQGR